MTISGLLTKVKALNIEQISIDSVEETKDKLLDKSREQLLEGKLRTGQDIFPTYLEDPFFKTKQAAQRYSDWKDRLTPNSKRKKGVPNLFITGAWVHDPLKIEIQGTNIQFDIPSPIGAKIFQKYGVNIVGLDPEKKGEYVKENLRPVFNRKVSENTGLKF